VVNFLFGIFALPESLAPAQRAPIAWRSIHPIGAVAGIWRDYPIIKAWQAATFLISFGVVGVNSIFFLYVTYRFGWTPKAIGIYSTFVMLTNLAVQTGLVAKAIRVLGERGALLAGLVVQIVGMAAAGFAPTGWLFTAAVVLLVVGGVAEPARLSIINRVIGPSDRGRLSGADRSIVSLTGIIAPGVFAALYASVVGRSHLRARWYSVLRMRRSDDERVRSHTLVREPHLDGTGVALKSTRPLNIPVGRLTARR
jgi:DHA1 family tetracycline resistance protein-like MFS transporter